MRKNRADGQLFKGGNLPVTLPSFNGKVRYELIDIDDALVDFNEEGVDAGCTLIAFTNINTDFYLVNSLVFLSANNLYANKVLEPINSVQVWAGPNPKT